MDERELLRLVASRAGLRGSSEAARAIRATLGALRGALADEDARDLGAALPRSLARALERRPAVAVRDLRTMVLETARRERTGRGFALEHGQVVLGVLARSLEPDLVARLRRRVPPDVASLLRPLRSPPAAPPPYVRVHPEWKATARRALSSARPGPLEPIAEARRALAHAGSVARSSEGHADRMVETARSTRPGREDETLSSTRGRS